LFKSTASQIFLLAVLVNNINISFADNIHKVITDLTRNGFENVRLVILDNQCVVTIENPVYRWDVSAIAHALNTIALSFDSDNNINLILLNKGMPQVTVSVRSLLWKEFINGEIDAEQIDEFLNVSENIHDAWLKVKNEKPYNIHIGKTDIVIYPQFAFENTLLSRLYEIQFNVAPAFHVSFWRGMGISGQVIVPVINELGYEGNFIRPGQVVLSQSFKNKRLSGKMAFGNFSSSRYGTDITLKYLLPNENLSIKGNAGYTGNSHFFDYRWVKGPLNTFTFSAILGWFIPRYDMEFEGGFRKYIYNDTGFYGSCTRWFGETAVGFYALASKVSFNGGFYFSVPFPMKKRNRKHLFRVTIPAYQDMIYNGGTEFYYGQSYRVGPDLNRIKNFHNASYLKNQLLRKKTSNNLN
jgi:hypothetical protein